MNLFGTLLYYLRSPSGFAGFNHVTNQTHILVNFLTCLFFNFKRGIKKTDIESNKTGK